MIATSSAIATLAGVWVTHVSSLIVGYALLGVFWIIFAKEMRDILRK